MQKAIEIYAEHVSKFEDGTENVEKERIQIGGLRSVKKPRAFETIRVLFTR